MDYIEILEDLRVKFPKKAFELRECLELLKITSDDLVDAVGKKINNLFQEKEYAKVDEYNRLAMGLDSYAKKINESIGILEVEEREKPIIPDYEKYLVNKDKEYSLLDSFTHKRPYAFTFVNKALILVDSWKDMTCLLFEMLLDINKEKMLGFEHMPHMNGKKRKYFAKNKRDLHTPGSIKGEIYIESNQSADSLKTLMLKVLKEYGFSKKDVKIYLRADCIFR